MIKHKFIVALFTLCYLLTACVAEDLQGPVAGSGEGYLVLQVGSISAEVQSAPLTKATTTLTDLPETSELMVNIKNEKGTVYGFPKQYAELGTYTTLPVGSYTIEAYYGSNSAIQSTPYFYDSKSIEITATSTTEVSLKPSLANAMLVPVVDEKLQKHYTDWKLEVKVVKVGSNDPEVLASKNNIYKLFVAEGSTVQVIFSGQNLIGENTSKESIIISNAAKQTQYTIQCNPENLPAFTLATTATAVHTTDAENKLNGTSVKVKVESLTGTPIALITDWKSELYNENNTLVRTFISTNAPANYAEHEMTADIDWPYLPQGNYTLKSHLTLGTGETVAAQETTVKVKAPTFTVTASAYTSYNKYLNGDIDGANACDGSTIYDMKAVPSISQNLLDNSNYNKSSSLKLDGNDVSEGNVSSQSWAAHTLEAFYTFDGISMSGHETYHVTGIPYKKDFRTDSSTDGWVFSGTSKYTKNWGIQFLYVYRTSGAKNYAKLFSPAVYCPDANSIKASYSFGAMFTSSTAVYNRSLTIYSGIVSNTVTHSESNSDHIANEYNSNKKLVPFTHEVIIQNQQRLSFYHNEYYPPRGDLTQYWAYISKLDIIYR